MGEPLRFARHPLVYLVEAADDICYEIMDIEDAHKLKILTHDETMQLLLGFFDDETRQHILHRIEEEGVADNNEKIVYLRACVIGKLENECVKVFTDNEEQILSGDFQGSLIDHISPLQHEAYLHCSDLSFSRIYKSRPVLDVELSGYQIIQTLAALYSTSNYPVIRSSRHSCSSSSMLPYILSVSTRSTSSVASVANTISTPLISKHASWPSSIISVV